MNLTIETQAHDQVTAWLALNTAKEDSVNFGPQAPVWFGTTDFHKRALDIKARYEAVLPLIPNVETKASRLAAELNQVLANHKLDPMFDSDFGPKELGTVAVIDNKCVWVVEYEQAWVTAKNGQRYPGFTAEGGFSVYESPNWPDQYLVGMHTREQQVMWFFLANEERSGLEMTEMFVELFQGQLNPVYDIDEVKVPMLDFNLKPDVSAWANVMTTDNNGMPWRVKKAMQQYILKVSHTGFEQIIATGMHMEMLSIRLGGTLVIDQPVYVCTTPTDDVKKWPPVGPALLGFDSWKAPEGTVLTLR